MSDEGLTHYEGDDCSGGHKGTMTLPPEAHAAVERAERMVLMRDSEGWVLALDGIQVAHFMDEEDARLFVEGILMLAAGWDEDRAKLEAVREALKVWKAADDFRFGPAGDEAETAEEMNDFMLKNQDLNEAARTALDSALAILRGSE